MSQTSIDIVALSQENDKDPKPETYTNSNHRSSRARFHRTTLGLWKRTKHDRKLLITFTYRVLFYLSSTGAFAEKTVLEEIAIFDSTYGTTVSEGENSLPYPELKTRESRAYGT
jgi:hypothetical protein